MQAIMKITEAYPRKKVITHNDFVITMRCKCTCCANWHAIIIKDGVKVRIKQNAIPMLFIEFGWALAKHGQSKDGTHNARAHIFSWLLIAAILWWGGFFDVILQ